MTKSLWTYSSGPQACIGKELSLTSILYPFLFFSSLSLSSLFFKMFFFFLLVYESGFSSPNPPPTKKNTPPFPPQQIQYLFQIETQILNMLLNF